MIILKVEPGKVPQRMEITGDLTSMQQVVGGNIQAVYPFQDLPFALVCHEEGKLIGLPLNRALRDDAGEMYDVIAGTFFLCGAPPEEETFTGLSEEQLQIAERRFHTPELFLRMNGRLIPIPVIPPEA